MLAAGPQAQAEAGFVQHKGGNAKDGQAKVGGDGSTFWNSRGPAPGISPSKGTFSIRKVLLNCTCWTPFGEDGAGQVDGAGGGDHVQRRA